jgi:hypothetical protein
VGRTYLEKIAANVTGAEEVRTQGQPSTMAA